MFYIVNELFIDYQKIWQYEFTTSSLNIKMQNLRSLQLVLQKYMYLHTQTYMHAYTDLALLINLYAQEQIRSLFSFQSPGLGDGLCPCLWL